MIRDINLALILTPIRNLNLPVRVMDVFTREGIGTAGELIVKSDWDLLRLRGIGPKNIEHIVSELSNYGLNLNMRIKLLGGKYEQNSNQR